MAGELVVRFTCDTTVAVDGTARRRALGQEDLLPADMAKQLARAGVVDVLGRPDQLRAARSLGPSAKPTHTAAADGCGCGGTSTGAVETENVAQQPALPEQQAAEQVRASTERRQRTRKQDVAVACATAYADGRRRHKTRDTPADDEQAGQE